MAKLVLKRGADRRIRAGHPWIYRGEIADLRGSWSAGRRRRPRRDRPLPRPRLLQPAPVAGLPAPHPRGRAGRRGALPPPPRRGPRPSRRGAGRRRRLSPVLERGRRAARARRGPLRARQRRPVPDPGHGARHAVDHGRPGRDLPGCAGVPGRRPDGGAHRGLRARARLARRARPRRGRSSPRAPAGSPSRRAAATRRASISTSATTAPSRRPTRAAAVCSTASATRAPSPAMRSPRAPRARSSSTPRPTRWRSPGATSS